MGPVSNEDRRILFISLDGTYEDTYGTYEDTYGTYEDTYGTCLKWRQAVPVHIFQPRCNVLCVCVCVCMCVCVCVCLCVCLKLELLIGRIWDNLTLMGHIWDNRRYMGHKPWALHSKVYTKSWAGNRTYMGWCDIYGTYDIYGTQTLSPTQ
jgi:hypothetical protein